MNDKAYQIASDGLPHLIDEMMREGASFDEAVEEILEQIEIAKSNKEEYTGY